MQMVAQGCGWRAETGNPANRSRILWSHRDSSFTWLTMWTFVQGGEERGAGRRKSGAEEERPTARRRPGLDPKRISD